MLTNEYSAIELQDYATYAPYFAQTPERVADYTFTNLWGWGEHYALEWKTAHNLCWIRQQAHHNATSPLLWAPVGNWETCAWENMPELTPGTVMVRVPELLCTLLAQRFSGKIVIEETRGQWEYVYSRQALATLSGKRLHKKKNHVNAFIKQYGETYVTLQSKDIPQALALQYTWCKQRDCEQSAALLTESEVVCSILRQWDHLPGLMGGALLVEGQMAAFTVGERLDENTLVVHFEKGLPEFRGVYQAINFCFANHAGEGFEQINREQDADEEGLRQAKESYCPIAFMKKNTVRFL